MNSKEIIENILPLSSSEKLFIIESILKSLDKPDEEIDNIWLEEAEQRLKAYREGRLEGIPIEDIFPEENK